MHGVKSVKSASTPTQTTKTLQENLNIAHQGASLYAPENTFTAVDSGADGMPTIFPDKLSEYLNAKGRYPS